jgi:hopanoid biosynthesis associated protein HpnK
MVAGPAAADAVARARRLPQLKVGLHLVLVEAWPTLPPEKIPDLVDSRGRFRIDMARLGLEIALSPAVRQQLHAEIAAQFAAYAATGLPLDHVDAHKHYHLHPTIAEAVIAIGRPYGMRSLRVPVEPAAILAAVEPAPRRALSSAASPWARLLRRRARRAGLITPDAVFGLAWSGAMTPARVAGLLRRLPPGRVELYTHPATGRGFDGAAPGYRYEDELAALLAPECIEATRRPGIRLGGYGDPL